MLGALGKWCRDPSTDTSSPPNFCLRTGPEISALNNLYYGPDENNSNISNSERVPVGLASDAPLYWCPYRVLGKGSSWSPAVKTACMYDHNLAATDNRIHTTSHIHRGPTADAQCSMFTTKYFRFFRLLHRRIRNRRQCGVPDDAPTTLCKLPRPHNTVEPSKNDSSDLDAYRYTLTLHLAAGLARRVNRADVGWCTRLRHSTIQAR